MPDRRIVIVGASVAGVRVARALRARGSSDELILVGEEEVRPYDKPALSKAVLAGRAVKNDNRLLDAAEAESLGIRLMLGCRAESVDVDQRLLATSAGPVAFDDLVIATGVRARSLPWADQPRVHLLRTQADAEDLRAALRRARRLVVVGGGFIGCEVAATARDLGLDVTLVAQSAVLGVAGAEVGSIMTDLHAARGVAIRAGVAVRDVRPCDDGVRAILDSGEDIVADLAVVGVGGVPNTEWLAGAGLDVTDGVRCDERGHVMRAGEEGMPLDHVFAVGDVARWSDPRTGDARRIEHWTNAVEQAVVVARVLAARNGATSAAAVEAHVPTAYVWSDQFDWTLHLVGSRAAAVNVARVATSRPEQVALVGAAQDGALAFAAVANWPRALVAIRKAAKEGAAVDEVLERLGSLAAHDNPQQATKGAVA